MKKITFWKSLFLLFALIVGSTSVWAEDIATWGKVSFAANTAVKASGGNTINNGTAAITSSKGLTTSGANASKCYYNGSGGGATIIISDLTLTNYSSISLSFYARASQGGSFTITTSANGTDYTNLGSVNISSTEGLKSINNIPSSAKYIKLVHSASTGSLYFGTITIAGTYENPATLDHISLSGTYPTTFTEKDEFSHEGMTVTAHYDGTEDTEDVTNYATFSGYDMNTTGNQTVTVSYTKSNVTKTTTYNITVNAGTKYTVTYNAGAGTCGTENSTEEEYLGGVTLPTATCTYSGWTLAGWATAATASTSTRPTLYAVGSTYHPTDNETLYAVYSLEGIDGTKYKRVTEIEEATSASTIIVVNNEKVLDDALGGVNAPSETSGLITPTNNIIWSLTGDNTDGYELTTTSLATNKNLGITNIPSSSGNLEFVNYNKKWVIEKHTGGDNLFVLKNKSNPSDNSKVGVLEYTSNKWKYYCVSSNTYKTTNGYSQSKLYVPVQTVYNSNPTADIIQPAVSFEKGNTTLYLDGTNTYTNTASVTGVDKSVSSYKSSNTSVATVAADGTVTAVGIGTTTITATLDAELGVHKAASAEYTVEIKNTTTIAGIKALTNSSTEVAFTADLTDAVVTYVQGNYAYIQDATAAVSVYISEHGLIAGKKINGAVSGTVKASYQIDQLIALDLSEATVTDGGTIPAAFVKTLAEIKTAGTDYDGKLVTVNAISVSKSSTTTNLTDGSKIEDTEVSFTMFSPNSGTSVNDQEKGNFTGFVSIYINGTNTTYRLNLYEQSQFVKTHNAPTAQSLTFAEGAVVLDEATDEYIAFTGQTVEGAQSIVSYAIEGDAIGTINAETGVVSLNATCGTATVTATAAAANITEGGVTTPYTETEKSYTITVNPRWTVTFSINGNETEVRQATFEAAVDVPEVEFLGNKVFVGWGETADATATVDMEATYTPTADKTFYALFATETVGEDVVNNEWYKNTGATGTDATTGITAAGNVNANNGNPKPAFGLTSTSYKTITLTGINLSSFKSATIKFDYQVGKSSGSYTTITISQFDSSNSIIGTATTIEDTNNNAYNTTEAIALNTACKKITIVANSVYPAYVDNIIIATTAAGISYDDFTSNVGTTNVIIDGNAESIDLSAMTDATALVGVHADEITYTRTMGKLSTLYLPYASTIPDGMTAYEFNGINDAGTALNFNVVEGTTLNAYTPYVLEQEASASKTLSATNVDIAADTNGKIVKGEWTLMGTIARIENADLLAAAGTGTPYVVQSDKKWHPVQTNAAVYIPAFRAYFIASEASGARIMEMNLGGETTSIDKLDVIDDLDDNTPIFNLAGQKVTKAYKGVVIQNGKKVVRK